MFFAAEMSEIARSPTRMGEALAAGLPIISNETVGDVAEIIRRHHVGVVVEDASQPSMLRAALALHRLLHDPLLPGRCRKAAETCFSLKAGVEAYHGLYSAIAAPRAASSG
jgi:glycosyltransferase involved in cell wall biosynthesis